MKHDDKFDKEENREKNCFFYFLFFCFLFYGVLFLKDIEEHKLRKRERESFKVVQKLFFGGTENRSSEINGKIKKGWDLFLFGRF